MQALEEMSLRLTGLCPDPGFFALGFPKESGYKRVIQECTTLLRKPGTDAQVDPHRSLILLNREK